MTGCPIKHGTTNGYGRHGCRCDECRAAALAYNRAYWQRRGRQPKGNPVEHDGVTYPTQNAAALVLGVKKSTISAHLERHGDLSQIGKPYRRRGPTKGKPVKIGPREWPSQMALAHHLGVSEGTVRRWLRRGDAQRLMGALMQANAREASAAAKAQRRAA